MPRARSGCVPGRRPAVRRRAVRAGAVGVRPSGAHVDRDGPRGQDLEQIAAEIAPGREAASVVAAISEINGLRDGRVRAGQTLITPRY
ncbi:hypothetical protein [Tsukamurella sp. PLM1]|uniref:hypothetical protein n=1 Tax=Tsukamurella sp. PLM1 TaxID=2929795 RepID=UPI0020C080A3|nr:hypothetical protein [Tsukamurella sp. PLM1]